MSNVELEFSDKRLGSFWNIVINVAIILFFILVMTDLISLHLIQL